MLDEARDSLNRIAHPVDTATGWGNQIWQDKVVHNLDGLGLFTLVFIIASIMLWQLGFDGAKKIAYWVGITYLILLVVVS